MHQHAQTRKTNGKWIIFTLAYLVMVLFGFVLQSLPPLFQHITSEIPFSHLMEGFLMGAFGIPGLFMPSIGATLLHRLDARKVVVAGLVTIIIGSALFASAGAYATLFAGRFVTGCGAMMLIIVAPLLVNHSFEGKNIGKIIGLFNTAVPLGLVLAVVFFSRIGSALGWRVASVVPVAASVAVLAVFAAFYRHVPRLQSETAQERKRGMQLGGVIFLMGLVNLLVNAGTAPFGTFAPQFFSSIGVKPGQASFIITLMMIETTLLGPFIGLLVDRVRNHRIFLIAAGLLTAAAFAALVTPGMPLVLGPLLLGAATAIVPVTMFPLLNEMLPREQVGMGLAVLVTSSNIGNNIGLGVFGLAVDVAGFESGFIILGLLGLLICPIVLRIRRNTIPERLVIEG